MPFILQLKVKSQTKRHANVLLQELLSTFWSFKLSPKLRGSRDHLKTLLIGFKILIGKPKIAKWNSNNITCPSKPRNLIAANIYGFTVPFWRVPHAAKFRIQFTNEEYKQWVLPNVWTCQSWSLLIPAIMGWRICKSCSSIGPDLCCITALLFVANFSIRWSLHNFV